MDWKPLTRLRFDRTTGLLDFFTGGGAHFVHLDGKSFFDLAIGKQFDFVATIVEQTNLAEGFLIDYGTRFEAAVEITDVDDTHDIAEIKVVETALGKAAVKGHLTAFETDTSAASGTGFLPFVAFTRGFAVT